MSKIYEWNGMVCRVEKKDDRKEKNVGDILMVGWQNYFLTSFCFDFASEDQ